MAHFSQDPELCDALTRGGDIFRRMSAALNNKPEAAVTAEERALAKRVCYGVMYGQGKAATALELAVAEEVAEECIQQFRARYPGVAQFLSDAVVNCRRLGYVETLYDRRRYLPAIYSRNPAERAQAERQAINTICQGSAADLVKTAMIRIHAALNEMEAASRSRGQGTVDGAPWAARMVLQIHDELLFEVHAGALPAVQAVIQQCMESAVQLRVPTPVNIRTGPSWGNLAPYVPPAGSR